MAWEKQASEVTLRGWEIQIHLQNYKFHTEEDTPGMSGQTDLSMGYSWPRAWERALVRLGGWERPIQLEN